MNHLINDLLEQEEKWDREMDDRYYKMICKLSLGVAVGLALILLAYNLLR